MYKIYYDSLTEVIWFISLNPLFKNVEIIEIKRRGSNEKRIDDLLGYDKPDIILCYNDKPVLILETTKEVPTGHNVGQRFARLVRGVESNILTIYHFPFKAKKHGKYAGICNLNVRLLKAIENMDNFHQYPLLAVNWPCDNEGELILDKTKDSELKNIIDEYISSGFNYSCNAIYNQICWMKNQYKQGVIEYPEYKNLPNSVIEYNTSEFIQTYDIDISKVPSLFIKREKTYLYKIEMSPTACKRQDPYTGMQFVYDYLLCRNGKTPYMKKNNLVLYFPYIDINIWNANNPNNLATKSSNWYLTANMMLFENNLFTTIIP